MSKKPFEPEHERDRYLKEFKDGFVQAASKRAMDIIKVEAMELQWSPTAEQCRIMKMATENAVIAALEHIRLAGLVFIPESDRKPGQTVFSPIPPANLQTIAIRMALKAAEEGRELGADPGHPVPPADPEEAPQADPEDGLAAAVDTETGAPTHPSGERVIDRASFLAASGWPLDSDDDLDYEDDFEDDEDVDPLDEAA